MMNVKSSASWPDDRTESRLGTYLKSSHVACGTYCVLNCVILSSKREYGSGRKAGRWASQQPMYTRQQAIKYDYTSSFELCSSLVQVDSAFVAEMESVGIHLHGRDLWL
jgi:hypothetical protein